MVASRDTKDYYDDFSNVYEKHRHHGYHQMIDDLEVEIVTPYVKGKKVLEAGCGTGLILQRVAKIAKEAVGVDLSPGMLAHARNRGLSCQEADLCNIPFEDESFDTVYSFKVLAHVPEIEKAIQEMSRVCKPGGHLILEFYNPLSIRGLIKFIKPASKITDSANDGQILTRYDSKRDIINMLSADLEMVDSKGVRIVTPVAAIHRIPIVNKVVATLEKALSGSPLNVFGGFTVVIIKKH